MAVSAPGEVEWDNGTDTFLVEQTLGSSGLWLARTTNVASGWDVTYSAEDLPTQAGVSPGVEIVEPMYPQLLGVHVETAALLVDLMAGMAPGTEGDLTWWDQPTDQVLTVPARARVCTPMRDAGNQLNPHRTVALGWVVPEPLTIAVVP